MTHATEYHETNRDHNFEADGLSSACRTMEEAIDTIKTVIQLNSELDYLTLLYS